MASSVEWPLSTAWGWTRRSGVPAVAQRSERSRGPESPDQSMTVADAAALAEMTEAALVDACLAGRTGAFDLIVERHRRPVYQLCYRFVGNHEDASDLSQDVFLRAYRGLRSFRGQSSLATWLYRIGVNVCLNRVTARTPPVESIEGQQYVDTRSE